MTNEFREDTEESFELARCLFDPLMVNRGLMEEYGLCAAVLIAELLEEEDRMLKKKKEGWFSTSQFILRKSVGLTSEEQETSMEQIQQRGVLQYRKEGDEWIVKINHKTLAEQVLKERFSRYLK